jgi:hypothetical protein
MTLQVSLVGEQPIPNLLPAFHLKPQKVLLIYSGYTEETFQRLEALMQDAGIQVEGLKCTDEYETVSIAQEIKAKLSSPDAQGEISFNLTGGTKAMVLAAFQCAREMKSQVMYLESGRGASHLYQYEFASNGNLTLHAQTDLPPLLSIAQFLDMHLGKNSWSEKGYSKDIGGAFEQAVGETLRNTVDEIKAGVHFLGVQGKREQADLDLVIRVGNQFGVVEVKDRKKATLDALKQLHYLSRLLGTYTRKFWVLSRQANEEHQAVIQATRTKIVEVLDFKDDEETLSTASAQKLIETIKAKMEPSK